MLNLFQRTFQGFKALDFAFDVVEVCGGSGILSKALAEQGLRVCPPIDLSSSPHYDITDVKLLDWIFQMIAEGRFLGAVCEPVCIPSLLHSIQPPDLTLSHWGLTERTQRPSLATPLPFVAWSSFGLLGGMRFWPCLSNLNSQRWHGCPSGSFFFRSASVKQSSILVPLDHRTRNPSDGWVLG